MQSHVDLEFEVELHGLNANSTELFEITYEFDDLQAWRFTKLEYEIFVIDECKNVEIDNSDSLTETPSYFSKILYNKFQKSRVHVTKFDYCNARAFNIPNQRFPWLDQFECENTQTWLIEGNNSMVKLHHDHFVATPVFWPPNKIVQAGHNFTEIFETSKWMKRDETLVFKGSRTEHDQANLQAYGTCYTSDGGNETCRFYTERIRAGVL